MCAQGKNMSSYVAKSAGWAVVAYDKGTKYPTYGFETTTQGAPLVSRPLPGRRGARPEVGVPGREPGPRAAGTRGRAARRPSARCALVARLRRGPRACVECLPVSSVRWPS